MAGVSSPELAAEVSNAAALGSIGVGSTDAERSRRCCASGYPTAPRGRDRAAGLDIYHSVVEATVQRARPVVLTALAAVLAFMPLTQSAFWGSLAYTLIGGTAAGTALILVFLPALYAIWYRVKPTDSGVLNEAATRVPEPRELAMLDAFC